MIELNQRGLGILYVCAKGTASNGRHLSLEEWNIPDVEPPEPTRLGEVVWLERFPDALESAWVS